ncbi:MAG: uncharacterized protein PWQ76_897 [Clostridiales bacterium]|nr:uncharacterized protein [Clostridiales bacterium]
MNIIFAVIAAFFAGLAASLGLGGGMVLIIYLTIFADIPQISAQGINLVFFIPIAILSIILHRKNHLIAFEWKKMLLPICFGTAGAFLGTYFANILGSELLSKIFAVFILIVGAMELFSKEKD